MRPTREVYSSKGRDALANVLAALEKPNRDWRLTELRKLQEKSHYWVINPEPDTEHPLPDSALYNALLACCKNPHPSRKAAQIIIARIKAFDAQEESLCKNGDFTHDLTYVSSLVRKTSDDPAQTPYEIACASGSRIMQELLVEQLTAAETAAPDQQDPRWLETDPNQLLSLLQGPKPETEEAKFNSENPNDRQLLFLIATHRHPVFAAIAEENKISYTQQCLDLWLRTTELPNFDCQLSGKKKTFFEWLIDYPETGAAKKLLTQEILQRLFSATRMTEFCIFPWEPPYLRGDHVLKFLQAGLSLSFLICHPILDNDSRIYFPKDLHAYFLDLLAPFKACLERTRWFDNGVLQKAGWLPMNLQIYLRILPDSSHGTIGATSSFIRRISKKDNPKRDPRIAELYTVFAEEPMNILAPKHLEIFEQWCNLVHVPGSSIEDLRESVRACPLKGYLKLLSPDTMRLYSSDNSSGVVNFGFFSEGKPGDQPMVRLGQHSPSAALLNARRMAAAETQQSTDAPLATSSPSPGAGGGES